MAVEIAGHRDNWQYWGARGLEEWLETAPWVNGGGVRCIHVATVSDRDLLVDIIERQVLAIDRRQSSVRLVEMDCASTSQLVEDVHIELGLEGSALGGAAVDGIASALRHLPLVIATPRLESARFESARRAVGQLVDHLARRDRPGALCVLIFGCNVGCGDWMTDDLSHGLPAGLDAFSLKSRSYLLWSAYLHYRLAWESGGQRELATSWSHGSVRLGLGADDDFEGHLNACAQAQWDSLREDTRDGVRQWCAKYVRGIRAGRGEMKELVRDGLLWRPTPGSVVRLKAWVARGMLLERSEPRGRDMLRASLVCLPLARALLERCFDLEASFRCSRENEGRRGSTRATETVEELTVLRDAFMNGGHPIRQLYPRDSPAMPMSLVSFSSVGQLRHLLGWSRREATALYRLATLRNALAHGHYVSWRMLSMLGEVDSVVNESA